MSESHVLYQQDGPVATITINRAEARNSMTFEMYDRLYDLCERVDADDAVRVMVLTAAGDKAFVTGTDINQFKSFRTKEHVLGYEERIGRVLGRIELIRKPTIARIPGDAVGGGLFMALHCDLRVAVPGARFGVPVARTLGNFPAPASYSRLVAAVGPFRARSMILQASLLPAAEAQRLGIVDEVVEREQIDERVAQIAAKLATHAPRTMAAAKEATRRLVARIDLQDAADLLFSCYLTDDFQEGVSAFLEKRPANWTNK
jgi:enoyl-CoA hydratase/carnithine racemase